MYDYFCAGGQKDLNDSVGIEEGLTKEEEFFRNTEPWRNIKDQSKFGTKHLRKKLAQLQMKLIHSSFEDIISEMKDRRDESAQELKALGDLPSTLMEKRALFRNVREEIQDGIGAETLNGRLSTLHSSAFAMRPSAEFHSASKQFQRELNSSRLANISCIEVGSKVIAMVGGEKVQDIVCFIDNKNDNLFVKSFVLKNEKQESFLPIKFGKVFSTEGKVYHAKLDGTFDQLREIPRKLARSDPQWINELIEKNRSFHLPSFIDPDVFEAIVGEKMESEWRTPAMKLLDFTASLMVRSSSNFINSVKTMKSLPSLTDYLIRTSSEVVETIKEETANEISKFIEREKTAPFTQNHYVFENLIKLRSKPLMDDLLSSIRSLSPDGDDRVSTNDVTAAILNIFEKNERRSIDDHMSEELMNALDSYGKVAYKRFVDVSDVKFVAF